MEKGDGIRIRHARLSADAAVLLSRRGDVWQTNLADISATGVRLARPQGWRGRIGDLWAVDMLFGDEVNVHLLARVARITSGHVALAFAHIPDHVQPALWDQLGGHADRLEPWDDDSGAAA